MSDLILCSCWNNHSIITGNLEYQATLSLQCNFIHRYILKHLIIKPILICNLYLFVVVRQNCCWESLNFYFIFCRHMYTIMYTCTITIWSNLSWMRSEIPIATVLRSSLHLYSEFHQECLNESTRWQTKLAGVTVNPLLRESLLLLPTQMNWHLMEEKESCARARIVTGAGGGWFYDNWRPPGTFHWCCSQCVSSFSGK